MSYRTLRVLSNARYSCKHSSVYRDIATKNPGEKLKLSTGVAVVRPRTDCWMSYEEYLALTS